MADCKVAGIKPNHAIGIIKIRTLKGVGAEERLGAVLGLDVPGPNTEVRSDSGSLATIGPGEWLFTAARAEISKYLFTLEHAFADTLILTIDLSAGRSVFDLTGDAVARLNDCCPMDLGNSAFPPGRVARTLVRNTPVFMSRIDADSFRVIVDQSHARQFHATICAEGSSPNSGARHRDGPRIV